MPERKKPTLKLVRRGKPRRTGKAASVTVLSASPANENIETGYPPAGQAESRESYIEGRLDLNRYLIKHPTATFYVRVSGDSMIGRKIYPGGILIVDRAVEAADGDVVIARINDELCVRQLRIEASRMLLNPANPEYKPLEVTDETDWEIWGRVMFVISEP